MTQGPLITVEDAIRFLRTSPEHRQLIAENYLGEDRREAAELFAMSGEFQEVQRLLGGVQGKVILDIGAGTGIATVAFCLAGAHVIALEPDPSETVGRGALARLTQGMACKLLDGVGEAIPLADATIDVVYCRQVLHHTTDLSKVMKECHRVLTPGGVLLACREHVVDNERDLAAFLAWHPVHKLVGGENAFPLESYERAIVGAGFKGLHSLSRTMSVISAYPELRSQGEVDAHAVRMLETRFGVLGRMAAKLPVIRRAVMRRASLRDRTPGRMYTFHAYKGS